MYWGLGYAELASPQSFGGVCMPIKKTPSKAKPVQNVRPIKNTSHPEIDPRGPISALGILIFGIGLILFISLFTGEDTPFFNVVREIIFGVMGWLGWFFPLIICLAGLLAAFSTRNKVNPSRLLLMFSILVGFASVFQVARYTTLVNTLHNTGYTVTWSKFISESFQWSRKSGVGGGALGAIFAYPLAYSLAIWGANILLGFVLLTLFLMLFRVRVPEYGQKMWIWSKNFTRQAYTAAKEKVIEWKDDSRVNAELRMRNAELDKDDKYDDDKYDGAGFGDSEGFDDRLPNPAPSTRAPKPPKPIVVSSNVNRTDEVEAAHGQKGGMYFEDIATDSSAGQERPRKQPGNLSYLAPHKETYDRLDVLPDDDAPPVEIIEADNLPWEPVPYVPNAPKNVEPIDVDVPSFARSASAAASVTAPQWNDTEDRKPYNKKKDDGATFERYPPTPEFEEYRHPPFELLKQANASSRSDTREIDAQNSRKLEATLLSFKIAAKVVMVTHGPAVTRYELQPGSGVKVSSIVSLTDDIALNMAAKGVRIEAPIPGKSAIGIEIPNETVQTVQLREVLESDEAQNHPSRLAVALGKDIAGRMIIANLSTMPHLLIAGATGSGKSVCINTIITSIIYRSAPTEVRMILVDPKVVELSVYNGIPHLEAPVVTNPKEAAKALKWAVVEMEDRYRRFAERGVRDIRGFNAARPEGEALMPQIVVIIDELADLMLVASNDVEESICRLAQLARAAGIHLIIATQRPSVNVITGVIKSNIPSRIAFAVASQVDARTILDTSGAEKLIGKGDMLYAPQGGGKPLRVQGCFISDKDVENVVNYVKTRHKTEYREDVVDYLKQDDNGVPDDDSNDADTDELFREAVEMSLEAGQASISMFQRRLRIGYARAGRLMDAMASRGIVDREGGTKPRPLKITQDEFKKMMGDVSI